MIRLQGKRARRLPSFILASTALALALGGCGKSIEQNAPSDTDTNLKDRNNLGPTDPSGDGAGPVPGDPSCKTAQWNFTQPDSTTRRSVDLLLVVDTSSSLSQERAKIASQLPSFVNELDPDTDLRVAVMLAHGGASTYSGRLYSPAGVPKVLSTRSMSLASLQSALTQTLSRNVADRDEADGEMLTYSLLRSFQSDRQQEIKAQGFYRDEAALSVLFISDENDVCYLPNKNGYSSFPDYVPSNGNIEEIAYARYCKQPGFEALSSPAQIFSAIRSAQGDRSIALGAISHVDPAKVPRASEDAIGHGLIELVKQTPNGVLLEITDSDWSAGLKSLGSVVSTQLKLKIDFKLDGTEPLKTGSVRVQIDGKPVESQYDAATRTVQIRASDAGAARSHVSVLACSGN